MTVRDFSALRHNGAKRWRQYALSRLLITSQIEQLVQEILAGDHDGELQEGMHANDSSTFNFQTPLGRIQVPVMPPATMPYYCPFSSACPTTSSQKPPLKLIPDTIPSRKHPTPGSKLIPPRSRQSGASKPLPEKTRYLCATQQTYDTSDRRANFQIDDHLENVPPNNNEDDHGLSGMQFSHSLANTPSPEIPPLHRNPSLQGAVSSIPIRRSTHKSPQNRRLYSAFTQQLNLEALPLAPAAQSCVDPPKVSSDP